MLVRIFANLLQALKMQLDKPKSFLKNITTLGSLMHSVMTAEEVLSIKTVHW